MENINDIGIMLGIIEACLSIIGTVTFLTRHIRSIQDALSYAYYNSRPVKLGHDIIGLTLIMGIVTALISLPVVAVVLASLPLYAFPSLPVGPLVMITFALAVPFAICIGVYAGDILLKDKTGMSD